jgi:hypothetical protein
MRITLIMSALLSLSTFSTTAAEHLTMAVSPLVSFAPSSLRIRARLVPNDANRSLEVVAESADFYRSSLIPLEGERAPAVITVEFRDVPTGDYEVYSVLTDASGERRAIARQRVRVVATRGE